MKQTEAQILLGVHLAELRIFVSAEYKFFEPREWRFDWANRERRLAFECNGGQFSGGHRRSKAVDDENEKLNMATLLGWRVLQFTNAYVLDGRAKKFIADWLESRKDGA